MEELTKKQLLDKLEENGFISAEQKKGFEKLTQEELTHLVESSEVILSLENQVKELTEKVSALEISNIEVKAEIVKPTPGETFTFRKEKYKFTDHAPKKIRYNNQVWTQKELAKNEDFIIELIGGNSSLIEKL